MGEYMMRKSKNTGEFSLMDIPSNVGVRTRAKTLALQKAAGSYIQLRSRRLVKPTPPKRQKVNRVVRTKPSSTSLNRVHSPSGSVKKLVSDEASFGENTVEIEGGDRTRETTPCNLISDQDTVSPPGSSTKRAYSTDANYRVQSQIPSTIEMDEFFTEPEKKQQRLFIEKYNFDPVNDKPLSGRYEWTKLNGSKKC